jgi:prolyl oligopeptidase
VRDLGILQAMRILLAIPLAACAAPAPTKPPATRPPEPTSTASTTPAAPAPAPAAARAFAYPTARTGNVVDTLHGAQVADPYRWLEDMDSTDARAWITAENTLTDSYLAAQPWRTAFRERITQLVSYESFGRPFHRGRRQFWIHRDGQRDQPEVWTAASLDAKPSVLLDANTFSTDGSLAFAGLSVSPNGERIAYGMAIGGGDWQKWRIRDVATGKDLPDELEHIKYYAPAFTRDGTGLYYSRFPAPPPGKELVETDHDCKIYFHRVGTPVASDKVVYEHTDHPTWQFDVEVTRDGRYLVITTGDGQVGDRGEELVSYLDLSRRGAVPVPLIDRYDAEYIFAGNDGPVFYLQTTLGAAHKRVIAIDVRTPARDRWKEVVPEGTEAIDTVGLGGRQIFVTRLKDAHAAVTAYDLRGKKLRDVALPGLGTAFGFSGAPEDKEAFYWFGSFTVPGTIYRYDFKTGASTLWKAPTVAFDPSTLETRQVFFPSKDGTKVPMFITAKRGLALDGSHPTMMTAYGFGGLSSTPFFDPSDIVWLERGGISVLVNIRGGGEYGEAWHLAAKGTHRQTGFDDFIAAGEWLIANKYTSAAHLGAIGTSGGGMLVGAVLVQRPDLFGAVVPIAGVLDLLRFHLFGQGAGWQGDLGSLDNPTDFAFLRTISPLHNVRAGTRYPATFIITSDHDVRVPPLHSYKFAAAMQAAQTAPAPVLMRVETESGHGGGSLRSQRIEQTTEILTFLAANLGLPRE